MTAIPELLTATPLPALCVDPATDRIEEANDAADALLGARLAGRHLTGFVAGDPGRLIVFADAVADRGRDWTRDLGFRDAGGRALSIELRGRLVAAGEAPRLILVLVDLSELERHADRAAAARLHRAGLSKWQRAQAFFGDLERRNRLILDAAGEGIYGIDAQGKTTFVNRAAEEMLGWSGAELLGRNMHATIHHHHLSGAPYPERDCPIYRAFRFETVNRIADEVFWRRDGRPIRVEYVSTPIYDDAVLAGAVVIFRDITERWENERKLHEALTEIAALRDRLEAENAYLQEEIATERAHDEIIGTSPAIRQIRRQIDLAAGSGANVLITGETGTGKAMVANAIHKAGSRHRRALIRFKCGAVPPERLDAELFGQARDGSRRDKAGKLELAHGGTLFLDDVTALPRDLQARLLAALQAGAVTRHGEDREREVDLQVVTATSADLDREIAAGRFSAEFYFFLQVFPIRCTPLRERSEDVPAIAAHQLRAICRRRSLNEPTITRATMRALETYSWPGNVRELETVMERGAIVSEGGKLVVDPHGSAVAAQGADPAGAAILTEAEIRRLERANLVSALRETGGKVAGPDGTAALLGAKPTTIYSRIRKLGLAQADWSSG